MLPPQRTREWARSLLSRETVADTDPTQVAPPTIRVYERLRQVLSTPVGVDGFRALASRAVALTRSESPKLSAVQITADGDLRGFSEVQPTVGTDQNGEAGVILIAQLLWLLLTFLGEATTLRLIEDVRLQTKTGAQSATTGSTVLASPATKDFDSLLREVDRLKSVSEGLEDLASRLPGMEDGLVSVAGNIRSIATVLDVFALIRSKSGGLQEDESKQTSTGYVM